MFNILIKTLNILIKKLVKILNIFDKYTFLKHGQHSKLRVQHSDFGILECVC